MQYIYKSTPFDHQDQVFTKSRDAEYYAFLMEQGTGKSKPTIDTAAYLFEMGEIQLFIVAAPNGVHRKWATEDIPLSLPDRIPHKILVWKSDGTVRMQKAYTKLLEEDGDHLRIFFINVEYLSDPKGADLVEQLLRRYRCFMAIDESSRIMNPGAKRTDNVVGLGEWSEYRRILNGLPVAKSPFDLFSQFLFLSDTILGRSFVAFKSQHAEFYPPTHPFIIQIAAKHNPAVAKAVQIARTQGWPKNPAAIKLPPGATYRFPQIIMTDAAGNPKWKNLEKLKAKIAPYSFRVTKEECFDLPPKIYQTRYFTMAKEQRVIYDDLYSKSRAILDDELVIVDHKLVLQLRLHQVACGYLPIDGKEVPIFKDERKNPRLISILDDLEEWGGQTIVWCRFKREVRILSMILGERCVTYYGDTEKDGGDKEVSKVRFQQREVDYLIGTAGSGGIGNNFANSSKGIFGSNTFRYDERVQAEDRQHRYGLGDDVEHVLYVDIQAEDSVDQDIVASMLAKQDLGDYMMGKKSKPPGAFLDA